MLIAGLFGALYLQSAVVLEARNSGKIDHDMVRGLFAFAGIVGGLGTLFITLGATARRKT